jgi:hypothetical protein
LNLAVLKEAQLARVMEFGAAHAALPQIEVQTDHVLHAGVYTRTLHVPAESVVVGALVKIPTTLIVIGHTRVFTGEEWIELNGYCVIEGQAGRKQIVVTQGPTIFAMIFRTDAKTIAEAEEEFTDEAEHLISRKQEAKMIEGEA